MKETYILAKFSSPNGQIIPLLVEGKKQLMEFGTPVLAMEYIKEEGLKGKFTVLPVFSNEAMSTKVTDEGTVYNIINGGARLGNDGTHHYYEYNNMKYRAIQENKKWTFEIISQEDFEKLPITR